MKKMERDVQTSEDTMFDGIIIIATLDYQGAGLGEESEASWTSPGLFERASASIGEGTIPASTKCHTTGPSTPCPPTTNSPVSRHSWH